MAESDLQCRLCLEKGKIYINVKSEKGVEKLLSEINETIFQSKIQVGHEIMRKFSYLREFNLIRN